MHSEVCLNILLLVVDNDDVVCDLIVEQLAEYGTSVEKAQSVEKALKSLQHLAPDLILSDLQRPPGRLRPPRGRPSIDP